VKCWRDLLENQVAHVLQPRSDRLALPGCEAHVPDVPRRRGACGRVREVGRLAKTAGYEVEQTADGVRIRVEGGVLELGPDVRFIRKTACACEKASPLALVGRPPAEGRTRRV
jgi:hypothetical protein